MTFIHDPHSQAHLQFAQANSQTKNCKRATKPTHGRKKKRSKLTEKMTENKEHQAVTGGIFYCRDSGYFSVSASNKLSCNLTGKCSEIGNKNIPPTVTNKPVTANNKEHW